MNWRSDCRVTGRIQPGRVGPWSVQTFEIGNNDLYNFKLMFSPGNRSTMPGTYTKLVHNKRGIVMSDTDAEISDMSGLFYKRPRGRVLVNGLGLGCVLMGLLAIPEVEHVDVVEVDEDVIELVGSQISDQRVVIHHDDAFTIKWPAEVRWDVAWHDVWDELCVDNLSSEDARPGSYAALHRKYGRKVGWQASWGFEFLQRERSKDARRW